VLIREPGQGWEGSAAGATLGELARVAAKGIDMKNHLPLLFSAALSVGSVALSLPAQAEGGLKIGEYACYGSGGQVLIGLGFKVLDASHYNDLDGQSPGAYSINGDKIYFRGGPLDGQVGADLKSGHFNLSGHGISCEPWG